jgi:hypothetical protein
MRALPLILGCGLTALAAGAQNAPVPVQPSAHMVRAVNTSNPMTQTTCLALGKTGTYTASVGDIVEVDYRFLDMAGCPPSVQASVTGWGAVVPSSLGFLPIDEGTAGYKAAGFFFEAVRPGSDVITLAAEGESYSYSILVTGGAKGDGRGETAGWCLGGDSAPGKLLRPWISAGPGPCSTVPSPHRFKVEVGDLVEMDCYVPTTFKCLMNVKIGLSGDGSVAPSPLGCRDMKAYGSYGVAVYAASFFEAVKPGKSTITFKVKGQFYRYVIKVYAPGEAGAGTSPEDADDDGPQEPEPAASPPVAGPGQESADPE